MNNTLRLIAYILVTIFLTGCVHGCPILWPAKCNNYYKGYDDIFSEHYGVKVSYPYWLEEDEASDIIGQLEKLTTNNVLAIRSTKNRNLTISTCKNVSLVDCKQIDFRAYKINESWQIKSASIN